MTTSLQTDPRRTARDAFRKPGRPPLEMPVLFQLADLSPQHVKVAPPKVLAAVVEPPATPEITLSLTTMGATVMEYCCL